MVALLGVALRGESTPGDRIDKCWVRRRYGGGNRFRCGAAEAGVAGGRDTVGDLKSTESGDLRESLKMKDPLKALAGWEVGEFEVPDFSNFCERVSKNAL